MKNYQVVGIGGLYLDVVAPVSYDFIKKHKIALNKECEVSRNTLQNVFSCLKKKELFAGGSAANTISGLASFGAQVGFYTKLAADPIGAALLQNFKKAGVVLCCPPVDSNAAMSPSCLILTTPKGERSILFRAENPTRFSDKELDTISETRCDYLLFEAAILLEKHNRLLSLLNSIREARIRGAKIVFNLQGSFSWDKLSVLPHDLASMSDIIIGNETEMDSFQKHLTLPLFSKQMIVTTQGKKGTTLRTKTNSIYVEALKVEKTVNSIGAGDQFLAGFLHNQICGGTLKKSLMEGAKTAHFILKRKGGRPNATLNALRSKTLHSNLH